jgi:hypothetical protein
MFMFRHYPLHWMTLTSGNTCDQLSGSWYVVTRLGGILLSRWTLSPTLPFLLTLYLCLLHYRSSPLCTSCLLHYRPSLLLNLCLLLTVVPLAPILSFLLTIEPLSLTLTLLPTTVPVSYTTAPAFYCTSYLLHYRPSLLLCLSRTLPLLPTIVPVPTLSPLPTIVPLISYTTAPPYYCTCLLHYRSSLLLPVSYTTAPPYSENHQFTIMSPWQHRRSVLPLRDNECKAVMASTRSR